MSVEVSTGLPLAPPEQGGDPEAAHARALVRSRMFGDAPLRIGRYVVRGRLGAGAMGTVFRARDVDLARDVAIKVLALGTSKPERMRREARALARLAHPNVVEVFETGVHDGIPYVVMELVEGRSLETWLREPRPLRAILEIFRDAGRGLAAAHAAGLVHRDFKPANVLIGDDGRVRVADFGLVLPSDDARSSDEAATLVPDPASSLGTLTATGKIVGTPVYMSPEQWRGAATDARSDQWSFCVSLWEACYGERPFAGESVESLCNAILSGRIDPSSTVRRVPGWLRAILERGLSTDPTDRFPDMAALLAELERGRRSSLRRTVALALVVGLVGLVALVPAPDVGDKQCSGADPELESIWSGKRKRETQAAIVATGVPYAKATAGHVIGVLDGWVDRFGAARRTICEAHSADDAQLDRATACLARQRHELSALVDLLAQADARTVEEALPALEDLPDPTRCTEPTDDGVPPPPEAVADEVARVEELIARSHALANAGQPAAALRLADQAVVDARATGHAPVVSAALTRRGWSEQLAGDARSAAASLTEAFEIADQIGADELAFAAARGLVYVVGHELEDVERGLSWSREAEARIERLGGDQRLRASLLRALGNLQRERGDLSGAQASFEELLAIYRSRPDPPHAGIAETLVNIATVRYVQGRFEDAAKASEEALAIRRERFGARHPSVASVLARLGPMRAELGDPFGALELLQEAREILEEQPDREQMELASVLVNLGVVHAMLEDNEGSAAALRAALAIYEQHPGRRTSSLVMLLSQLAPAEAALGRTQEAIALLERARVIAESGGMATHPAMVPLLGNLAQAQAKDGYPERAIATLEDAIELAEQAVNRDDAELAALLVDLSAAHVLAGRIDAAAAAIDRADALARDAWRTDDPHHITRLFRRAELELARDEPARAIEALEEALERSKRAAVSPSRIAEIEGLLATARSR